MHFGDGGDLCQQLLPKLVDDLLDAARFEGLEDLMHQRADLCRDGAIAECGGGIGVQPIEVRATCAADDCGCRAAWCTGRARSRGRRCRPGAAGGSRRFRSALRRSPRTTGAAQFDAGSGALRSGGREGRAALAGAAVGNLGGGQLYAIRLRIGIQKRDGQEAAVRLPGRRPGSSGSRAG